jgi:hypothetical protein
MKRDVKRVFWLMLVAMGAILVVTGCSNTTTVAVDEVDSAETDAALVSTPSRLDPDDPNRQYLPPNLSTIGTAGDIQFVNSFATW